MQASLDVQISQKDWKRSAIRASNLSELYLTLGDVTQALAYAEQSVELADRSGDAFLRMVNRTKIADALHQAGRLAEAEAAFREAEEMQKKNQPEFLLLYSVQGYHYCDLLLSQGKHAEVLRRASQTLEWAKQYNLQLLTLALDNLSLGRSHLLQSQHEPNHSFAEAGTYLNRAVDGLRESGNQDDVPRGLLARTEYYRITGTLDKAKRDLDEAFSIATRGGMGLYLADCHLEYARLALATPTLHPPPSLTGEGRGEGAREHLAIAKKMIDEMGYHRRDKEVRELVERLKPPP